MSDFWTGRLPRPICLFSLLFIVLCSVPLYGLTLKETAEVVNDQILLKDIILEATEDSPWGRIVVWQAPSINTKRSIYKSFVITLFRQNGYFLEAETLEGPNKVDVKRVQIDDYVQNEVTSSPKLDYKKLWLEVEEQLSFRLMELIPHNFIFEITPERSPEEILWPANTASILVDLSVLRDHHFGKVAIPVDVLLTNGQKRRIFINVTIEYEGVVYVVSRDFRVKEQLDSSGITKENRKFTQKPSNIFTPDYDLNYYQSKTFLRNGDLLLQAHVELRPVKQRGERVKLSLVNGAISIEVMVELLEDAIPFKRVRARNLSSGKEIYGVVQLDGSLIAMQ